MNRATRAQSGLDRLLLFVVFLVVLVAITPAVFGLGGIELRAGSGGTATPAPTAGPTDHGVIVLGVTGVTGGFGEDTIGVVRVVVTKAGTGPAVDATSITTNWVGPDGAVALSAADSADAQFGVDVIGSTTPNRELDRSRDRAVLTFDRGTDDVEKVDEFGRRLESGDIVTLELTTDSGTTERVTFDVPGSLGAKDSVRLPVVDYRPNSR